MIKYEDYCSKCEEYKELMPGRRSCKDCMKKLQRKYYIERCLQAKRSSGSVIDRKSK